VRVALAGCPRFHNSLLSSHAGNVLSEQGRKNLELSDLEIFAFIASVFLTLKGWLTWYGDIASVNRLRVPIQQRFVLLAAPLVCLVLILVGLTKLAATTVRSDALYISFYLLVGAGWLGGVTLIFPYLGISARDDVLERGNRAASSAITGALTGASCAFAGANVGNGPGVQAVLFSAVLSSAQFIGLWFGMDLLTSISDAITVDRNEGAGIRLGGFLLGIGLLSGWSVAGDWASAFGTLKDFAVSSLPAILLTAVAVVVELTFRSASVHISAKTTLSVVISAVYVSFALVWVVARGVHS
jgi:uncharacterized membrane protein YjfL (UPF0719 family)